MGHNILISIFSGIGTGIISTVIPLILFRKILKDTSLRVEKYVKQYLEQKVSDREKYKTYIKRFKKRAVALIAQRLSHSHGKEII